MSADGLPGLQRMALQHYRAQNGERRARRHTDRGGKTEENRDAQTDHSADRRDHYPNERKQQRQDNCHGIPLHRGRQAHSVIAP